MELFLFGGKGKESDILRNWIMAFPNTKSPIHCPPYGKGLESELEQISNLDIMLTMDSANMHIASLVGTRVVSIWGGTTPACGFLGWGQKNADAIMTNCKCQPCTIAGSNRCKYGDFHCLTMITPERIVKTILQIIN